MFDWGGGWVVLGGVGEGRGLRRAAEVSTVGADVWARGWAAEVSTVGGVGLAGIRPRGA